MLFAFIHPDCFGHDCSRFVLPNEQSGFIFLASDNPAQLPCSTLSLWNITRQPIFPFPIPKLDFKEKKLSFPLVFIVISAAVAILNLVYVFFVPPNNNDSLMIHLARLGMWDQFGSWLPWNTKVVWQLTFPFNAEIVSYWTLLFTRSERLLGLITYISGYFSIILLYRLRLELTAKRCIAVISAFIWAAFPVVQLNFTSTRHDHVSSLLSYRCGLLLLFSSEGKKHWLHNIVRVGNRFVHWYQLLRRRVFAWSGDCFCFLLALLQKTQLRECYHSWVFFIMAFFLFSSPVFISNYVHFGSLLGPDAPESGSVLLKSALQEDTSTLEHTGLMAGRWAYQIVDFQGIPEPYLGKLMQYKAVVPDLAERNGVSLEVDKSLLNQHIFRYSDHIPFSRIPPGLD